jgi:hypothetical protein
MPERVHVHRHGDASSFDVDAHYDSFAYHNMNLSLKPADHDWMFSIYSGEMTTDSEARHLNIRAPIVGGQPMQWKPESDVFLKTGPCERELVRS